MSVVPRREFCRRQDNVIQLPVLRSQDGRQGMRDVEDAEEGVCAAALNPHGKFAAILWLDSTLMVGG